MKKYTSKLLLIVALLAVVVSFFVFDLGQYLTLETLAGGALFGLGIGFVVVSFASSFGATLAFLVSRFLLRDAVQAKFREKLVVINEGIR